MKYHLFPNIREMVKPETLDSLVGESPLETCLEPFTTAGWSSTEAEFLGINGCNGEPPSYVLKRLRSDKDWVMKVTNDQDWRAISVWQYGLLDLVPEEIEHGIVACATDDDGYAILMRNFTEALLLEDRQLSIEDHAAILTAIAKLHGAFWEHEILSDQRLNLCTPEDFFSHTSPQKAKRIALENPSFVLEMIIEGRKVLSNFIDAELAELTNELVHDPAPLCNALTGFPKTLVHGDARLANLGLKRGRQSRLIMLDWARPVATVPAVDLVYYLNSVDPANSPVSIKESVTLYKKVLEDRLGDRFSDEWWKPQLELSMLGVFTTMACFGAWVAQNSDDKERRKEEQANLQWWANEVRPGLKLLS